MPADVDLYILLARAILFGAECRDHYFRAENEQVKRLCILGMSDALNEEAILLKEIEDAKQARED